MVLLTGLASAACTSSWILFVGVVEVEVILVVGSGEEGSGELYSEESEEEEEEKEEERRGIEAEELK